MLEGVDYCLCENLVVGDDVVGRRYDYHCFRIPFQQCVCGVCKTWSRVPAVGLKQKVSVLEFRKLLLYDVLISLSRNHQYVFLRDNLLESVICLTDEGLSGVCYVKELLRLRSLADRPETSSETSGQDDAVAMIYVHVFKVLLINI